MVNTMDGEVWRRDVPAQHRTLKEPAAPPSKHHPRQVRHTSCQDGLIQSAMAT
jgi:hypothetical protein